MDISDPKKETDKLVKKVIALANSDNTQYHETPRVMWKSTRRNMRSRLS